MYPLFAFQPTIYILIRIQKVLPTKPGSPIAIRAFHSIDIYIDNFFLYASLSSLVFRSSILAFFFFSLAF